MSTDYIIGHLEAMREDLIEFVNNEPLDILDEFTAEEIAECVLSIAERLMVRDFCNGHLIKYGRPNIDYLYHVSNKVGGVVSVSDACSTGVSNTLYKPFYSDDEDGYFTGLCNLAQMINEAWYQINKD